MTDGVHITGTTVPYTRTYYVYAVYVYVTLYGYILWVPCQLFCKLIVTRYATTFELEICIHIHTRFCINCINFLEIYIRDIT